MFKQLLFFFCLGLIVLGGYKLYLGLAPAETKVKWVIQSAAEAFNTRNKDECLAAFADDYRDTSQSTYYDDHTIDKKLLGKAMTYVFQNRVDQDTGAFMYKVEPVMPTMSVIVKSEIYVVAQFRIEVLLKMGHRWSAIWGADVKVKFRNERGGWVIAESALRTVMGHLPWEWED